MLNRKSSEPKKKKKINQKGNSNRRGTLKKQQVFISFVSSSSKKHNAQLIPQYLKKLKTLQNISFVYIYICIYIYIICCFFFLYFKLLLWVCEWVLEALGDPRRATVWETNIGRAVLTGDGSFKHTMHMILASLSAHTKTVCSHVLHALTSAIETNRKRARLECFNPRTYSYMSSTLFSQTPPSSSEGSRQGVCLCF